MTKFLWRIIAVILFLIWTIVFISNNYFDVLESIPNSKRIIDNILNGIPLLLSILLVIFPTKFVLYTIMCCFMGIDSIFLGNGINAYLMYILGCLFAYKAGILFKNKILTFFFIISPFFALISQYRFGYITILESFLDLLFLFVFFSFAYILLREYVESRFGKPSTAAQNIGVKETTTSILTVDECDLISEVLEDRTFLAIAKDRYKSESTIKKQMVSIYKKLGIKTKQELFELHQKGLLDFVEKPE